MPIYGTYENEAMRFREEIKKKFKTQIALCKAIGAKDGSYVTGYVTGKNRIGNILREKLEAVGIDVNYILYGKKKPDVEGATSGSSKEVSTMLFECTELIFQLQNTVIDMNRELVEVNQLLDSIRKNLNQ
jgi:hypothetical protein